MEQEGPEIAKTILKKNEVGGLKLPGFRNYTALVIKTVIGGIRQKQISETIVSVKIDTLITDFFTKKNSVAKGQSSTNAEIIGYAYAKENFNPYPVPYTKINSRWVIDLNVRIKL